MMNRVFVSALIVLGSLIAAFAASQGVGTIKGKIETEKGKPIAGAEVRAMRNRDRSVKETKTDEAGNFSFELVPDDYPAPRCQACT